MRRLVLLVGIFLIGCNPVNTYCPKEETKQAIKDIWDINTRWNDGFELASAVPRENLSPAIETLQEIKRNLSNVYTPECLEETKYQLYRSMESYIDSLIAFMGDKPDSVVSGKLEDGIRFMDYATESLVMINDCLPDCKKPE